LERMQNCRVYILTAVLYPQTHTEAENNAHSNIEH